MFSHACVILSVHRGGGWWLPSRHHWLHEQEGSASRGGSESRGGLHRGGSASGILQDMVSKQAVRILLECILVFGQE